MELNHLSPSTTLILHSTPAGSSAGISSLNKLYNPCSFLSEQPVLKYSLILSMATMTISFLSASRLSSVLLFFLFFFSFLQRGGSAVRFHLALIILITQTESVHISVSMVKGHIRSSTVNISSFQLLYLCSFRPKVLQAFFLNPIPKVAMHLALPSNTVQKEVFNSV